MQPAQLCMRMSINDIPVVYTCTYVYTCGNRSLIQKLTWQYVLVHVHVHVLYMHDKNDDCILLLLQAHLGQSKTSYEALLQVDISYRC